MLTRALKTSARRTARLMHRTTGWMAPQIQIHRFERRYPKLFSEAPRPEGKDLVSQICRYETLASPTFRSWLDKLQWSWEPHRKPWELAFVCQALDERGMLKPGTKGLGFAVGVERLPAIMAAHGCRITATDLAETDTRSHAWSASGQWVGSTDALNAQGICSEKDFRSLVSYRPVDMNRIPDDLTGYDFTWSTCSFEHCGSLDLGLAFLERQLNCLRPGGIAVHTTEFNLSSNDDTLENGNTVIYRLRDIESFCQRLTVNGHTVAPLDVRQGDTEYDRVVDRPPYRSVQKPHGMVKHLRLNLDGFATTSMGLIIQKAA